VHDDKQHRYAVYIIASATGTLYTGVSGRFFARTMQHKAGEIEGFSKKYHCNRLVYYETYDNVLKAISREKQLKGWSRAKKIALIERKNPRWQDLAENWDKEILFKVQSITEAEGQTQQRIRLGELGSRKKPGKEK
jgi:putative endonuclease